MIDVKLLRIITGEEVIAELVTEDENTITVKNGLVVLPGAQNVGFGGSKNRTVGCCPVRRSFEKAHGEGHCGTCGSWQRGLPRL